MLQSPYIYKTQIYMHSYIYWRPIHIHQPWIVLIAFFLSHVFWNKGLVKLNRLMPKRYICTTIVNFQLQETNVTKLNQWIFIFSTLGTNGLSQPLYFIHFHTCSASSVGRLLLSAGVLSVVTVQKSLRVCGKSLEINTLASGGAQKHPQLSWKFNFNASIWKVIQFLLMLTIVCFRAYNRLNLKSVIVVNDTIMSEMLASKSCRRYNNE